MKLVRPDGAEVLLGSPFDQVYSMVDNTDGWQYCWSVAEATNRARIKADLVMFSLSEAGITPDVIRSLYEEMDEARAMSRDLSVPVLFIPFKERHQLIDGWHRLFKAAMIGVDMLPALILSQEDADASLILKQPPEQPFGWYQDKQAA